MNFEKYLTERATLKRKMSDDINGMKQYEKEVKIKCYTKNVKSLSIQDGLVVAEKGVTGQYFVKKGKVREGDLINGKEVESIKELKKTGLVIANVK